MRLEHDRTVPRLAGLARGFERVDGSLAVRVRTEVTVQIGCARQVDAHENRLTGTRLLSCAATWPSVGSGGDAGSSFATRARARTGAARRTECGGVVASQRAGARRPHRDQ